MSFWGSLTPDLSWRRRKPRTEGRRVAGHFLRRHLPHWPRRLPPSLRQAPAHRASTLGYRRHREGGLSAQERRDLPTHPPADPRSLGTGAEAQAPLSAGCAPTEPQQAGEGALSYGQVLPTDTAPVEAEPEAPTPSAPGRGWDAERGSRGGRRGPCACSGALPARQLRANKGYSCFHFPPHS